MLIRARRMDTPRGAGADRSDRDDGAAARRIGRTFLSEGALSGRSGKTITPEELAGGATLFHEHFPVRPGLRREVSGRERGRARGERAAARPGPRRPWRRPPIPAFMRDPDLMAEESTNAERRRHRLHRRSRPSSEMGRDIASSVRFAIGVGMPVVIGGGFYSQPWFPRQRSRTMSEDQIFKALIEQADDDVIGAWGEIGSWDESRRTSARCFARSDARTSRRTFPFSRTPASRESRP